MYKYFNLNFSYIHLSLQNVLGMESYRIGGDAWMVSIGSMNLYALGCGGLKNTFWTPGG